MVKEEVKEVKKKDKKTLTIFLLMIPSLLMAMTASINSSSVVVRLGFQLMIILLQYVLVKNLIDDFYGDKY